jgi:hypothetical protein
LDPGDYHPTHATIRRRTACNDASTRKNVSFKYYLSIRDKWSRNAFKIALGLGNMRLHQIQHRNITGDGFVDNYGEDVNGKGIVGNNTIIWMQNYFRMYCEVMPITGRLHLLDIILIMSCFQFISKR